jgi:hypothetical protein
MTKKGREKLQGALAAIRKMRRCRGLTSEERVTLPCGQTVAIDRANGVWEFRLIGDGRPRGRVILNKSTETLAEIFAAMAGKELK